MLLVEQEFSQASGSVVSPEHVSVNSGEVTGFGEGRQGCGRNRVWEMRL